MVTHNNGLANAWAIAECPVALANTSASAFNSRDTTMSRITTLAHVRPRAATPARALPCPLTCAVASC